MRGASVTNPVTNGRRGSETAQIDLDAPSVRRPANASLGCTPPRRIQPTDPCGPEAALRLDAALSDMTAKTRISGWWLPVIALVGGLLAGAVFGLSFVALRSNWKQLAWVTPDAESTVPFWTFQGLIPIVVSVGWTGFILHARSHRRGLGLERCPARAGAGPVRRSYCLGRVANEKQARQCLAACRGRPFSRGRY